MSLEAPFFTVGPAPHWRSGSTVTKMNLAFILALLPTAVIGAAIHAFGEKAADLTAAAGSFPVWVEVLVVEMGVNTGALWFLGMLGTLFAGMGLGMLIEYVCQMIMRQPYRALDGHGALMGLLMAMFMPPSIPIWVLIVGLIITIFLGKQVFGGIGGYPMHPAMVGWLVLLLSWPNHLYPVGMASIAAPHAAAVIATGVGGLALMALGHIRWQIPVGVLIGVGFSAWLFKSNLPGTIADQFLTGHVVIAAFFLAPDPSSSPANKLAMWIYGIGMGIMIMLIRAYGIWADAVPFAVILVNMLHPLLDRIHPRAKDMVIQNG